MGLFQKSCVTLGFETKKTDMTMNKNILAAVLIIACAITGSAQVRLGVRGGVTLSKLRFDRNIIDSDNRVGYTAGLVLDLNIPVVGLGVEASAMYTHRTNRLTDGNILFKRHFIDIPVYARYRMTLPSIEHVVAPIVFTGPSLSILFDENLVMRCPSIVIVPLSTLSSPPIAFRRVVLPQPDGPRRHTIPLSGNVIVVLLMTWISLAFPLL